ncbi:MAG: thioesterase family protein, partial [bacterium]
DYFRSLTLGDRVLVEVRLVRLGTTSFTIDYQLTRTDGAPVGRCRMVHVAIDKVDRNKIPLPDAIKELLAPLPRI